jgi:hypothetical protein
MVFIEYVIKSLNILRTWEMKQIVNLKKTESVYLILDPKLKYKSGETVPLKTEFKQRIFGGPSPIQDLSSHTNLCSPFQFLVPFS